MSEERKVRENEIKSHLRSLEQKRDDLEVTKRAVWQQEDDEDMELTIAAGSLERMTICCSPDDRAILQLIEEKQEIMNNIRNKKLNFATEFEYETKKIQKQIDWEMEDTYMQYCI